MDENENNSISLAYDLLQKEYELEESRNKHLETKAQIMLALCGILISANMLLFKSIIESNKFVLINMSLTLIALILLTYAIYELLSVLKIRKFEKINHKALASETVHALPEIELKKKLIVDYNNCIEISFDVLKSKSNSIKYGANLIEVSVVIYCIILLLIVVLAYFERRNDMSEKTSSNTGSANSQTQNTGIKPSGGRNTTITESSTNNSTNKGEGLGTITVERGHKK